MKNLSSLTLPGQGHYILLFHKAMAGSKRIIKMNLFIDRHTRKRKETSKQHQLQ